MTENSKVEFIVLEFQPYKEFDPKIKTNFNF
ncbi:hypothetical protein SAMN06265367_104326 [Algoriphagus winogradskyi]|uniref:Uncharacterized protein n=1 Tax=Algoriphagus winogradskyi TaxID=237017 RepID=A0ABY1P488_9BACT|nr:hypothetical protein SAMN06265367_104326 [Algoriphagus winogradskyi]